MIEPTDFMGLFIGLMIYRWYNNYERNKKIDRIINYIDKQNKIE